MKITNEVLDLRNMSELELNLFLQEARRLEEAILAELDRWSTVRCEVCQRDNIAYRGAPFIGWTTSSGYTLCNICTSKYERKYGKSLTGQPVDNPVDEIMALLD